MRPFLAMAGVILVGLGIVACVLNLGGLFIFLKLRNLKRRGVEGKAVSTLQEWISSGHRVYYDVLLPGAPPQQRPPRFIEIGPEPQGPVGTVVPVVYDRRKPSRAKTGRLADVDPSEEWGGVKSHWGIGLVLISVGWVLILATL
ncbi:DUF3592 domain-containing protein [Streptomyces yerevanensis]|uniref:DUF3592 domain-containing protein n=1 Tax=Streptomyces yerevanensis TaxID=66378 RepID=UPI0012FECF72|nr:DUF3592 domain-containing protein [Streptomyces yerevanensis]